MEQRSPTQPAASALHALLLLVLAAAGCYWLIQRPTFALREIRIDGDTEHINSPTVRAGVVGRLKGNFFTVDLDAARAAFEQMPWVRHASVRRVWPNALAVTLEEYKPLGTWGSDQLVSVDGELFTANQASWSRNCRRSTARRAVRRKSSRGIATSMVCAAEGGAGRSDAVGAVRVDGEAVERHAGRAGQGTQQRVAA